jgi:predicted nucleic acid-binding protein
MRFWDTSALVPLFVDEPTTESIRALLSEDPAVVVWQFTGVELLSTLGRLGRQSEDLADLLSAVRASMLDGERRWTTVTATGEVRRRAGRLVGVHPLSAADALQLAAAQVASQDRPETLAFVTLDAVLARAARLEGFRVLSV